MKKTFISRIGVLVMLPVIAGCLGSPTVSAAPAEPGQNEVGATASETSRVVAAADAFLATLDEKQRAKVLFAFDDKEQRARWSNFPTGFVPRGGVSLRELNETQRAAALALVASALSQRGFEKVRQIMEADEMFKALDKGPPPFGNDKDGDHHGGPPPGNDRDGSRHGGPPRGDGKGGDHGGPPPGGFKPGDLFGQDLYYLSILGTPSEKAPWMLQYGGHHLALNLTIAGERGALTPTLTGAQPDTYTTVSGQTVRPLGQENDKAFALLNTLNENQRRQAILKYRVADLVLGPGHDGETIQPEGIKASALDDKQRAMLLDVISEWAEIVNGSYAAARMAEIKEGLDETWFAWSGPVTVEAGKNGAAYYRIQGPKLVIEYAPQPGDDHVHTMYRDPTDDYGRAFTTAR